MEASKKTFSFVPAEASTPGARLLLTGNLWPTGFHAGPSPEETGEGRRSSPTVPEESSDESEEEEEEALPKRGASAPPSSANLRRGGFAPKIDIGWKEDRAMFRRFGHLNAWSDHGSCSPAVIESYDSLGPTRLHLEIVSASAMPGVDFDRHYDVSPSLDLVKNSLSLLNSFHSEWTLVAGSLRLTSRRSLELRLMN